MKAERLGTVNLISFEGGHQHILDGNVCARPDAWRDAHAAMTWPGTRRILIDYGCLEH